MTTKHTPGPWIEDAGEEDEIVIREPGGEVIAVVCDSVIGEHSPNATLIAAAPDLLEALKRLMGNENNRDHWIFAQEAIAKAEGR